MRNFDCQIMYSDDRGGRTVCESAAAGLLGIRIRIPPEACMSVFGVVCCQIEVSRPGWSVVRRGPTECGVFEGDRETWIMRRPWHSRLSRKQCDLYNARRHSFITDTVTDVMTVAIV